MGWVKGYNGSAATVEYENLDGSSAGWKEKITVPELVTLPDGTKESRDKVLQADHRFKIVRSPKNPFGDSFGRYA